MAPPVSPRYPVIDPDACQLCPRCQVVRACRWQAVIRFDRDEPPVIDAGRCTLCWACVDVCEVGAVVVACE
ncbi:MAG TPA: 4Fe-4S binding protein [Anaerolineae bacterium]|nr:4Fe-4S binding protein [Anaerolineae bacterium]